MKIPEIDARIRQAKDNLGFNNRQLARLQKLIASIIKKDPDTK